ncbi:MAG: hypothetical protein RR373_08330 [Akkermansia sp.]
MIGQIKDERLPEMLRRWFRRFVLFFGKSLKIKDEIERAKKIMEPEVRAKVDAKFMRILQDFAGLDEEARAGRAMREEQKQILAESMDGIPEIGEWARCKLPRPNEARESGDDLTGELQRIYDAKTRLVRKRSKKGVSFEQKNVLGAEQYFNKDSRGVASVFEHALEEGFEFENSGEMLSAIYDSLVYGRKTFAAKGMSDHSLYSAVSFSVSSISSEDVVHTANEMRDKIKPLQGQTFTNKGTGIQARISGRTKGKAQQAQMSVANLTRVGFSDADARIIHYSAAVKINELFENAEDAFFEECYKNDPSRAGAYHFFNTVEIEGYGAFDVNVSAVALKERKDGNIIYGLELTIENPRENGTVSHTLSQRGATSSNSGVSSRKLSSFRSFVEKEKFSIKKQAEKDGSFMKAPNGKQTKLTEDQWLTVRTKAFKSWFGDWEHDSENASRVVVSRDAVMDVISLARDSGFSIEEVHYVARLIRKMKADDTELSAYAADALIREWADVKKIIIERRRGGNK